MECSGAVTEDTVCTSLFMTTSQTNLAAAKNGVPLFDWTVQGRKQDRDNARKHSDLLKELLSNGAATIDKLTLVEGLEMFDVKVDRVISLHARVPLRDQAQCIKQHLMLVAVPKRNWRTGCRFPSWLTELCDFDFGTGLAAFFIDAICATTSVRQ